MKNINKNSIGGHRMTYYFNIALILIVLALTTPSAAFAQGGIVPCGTEKNADGTITNPCDPCHLYVLAKNIVDFLLFDFTLPVAVIALLIGGIFLLASRGNPQMLETGKKATSNTVIGVVIAFGAWLIIATIANTLGYKGFTAAWNEAPTCAPSLINQPPPPPTPGGEGRCDYTSGQRSRPCTTPSGAPGRQFCQQNNTWTLTCFEICQEDEVGKERACKVGSCDGSQKCVSIGSGLSPTWSACQKKDPSCSGGGGTCQPVETGPCSVGQLSSSCFGNLGSEASQICRGESGGNRFRHGDPVTGNGRTVFRSIGLFQINLSVHAIGGLPCPSAFEGSNKPLKNTPEALELYNKCVAAAEDAKINIEKACEIRNARGNWQDWWCVAYSCGLHSTPCPR